MSGAVIPQIIQLCSVTSIRRVIIEPWNESRFIQARDVGSLRCSTSALCPIRKNMTMKRFVAAVSARSASPL